MQIKMMTMKVLMIKLRVTMMMGIIIMKLTIMTMR